MNKAAARELRHLAVSLLIVGVAGLLVTCSPRQSELDKLRALGTLRVATINSPTSYFTGLGGEQGFDFDLVSELAEHLGVELQVLVADSTEQVLDWVERGVAQVGAVGLVPTAGRRDRLRFTVPLRTVRLQLVYRLGSGRPRSLSQVDDAIYVSADSGHAEKLRAALAGHPEIELRVSDEHSEEDLLRQVAEGQIQYTVAASDLIAINRRYYPQLGVAFSIGDETELAWVVADHGDDSLYEATNAFLQQIDETEMARIKDRYFGHLAHIGYVGAMTLARHVETRLPKFRKAFEQAAAAVGMDWRLLAAIGYQESHWNPRAVSPTGVRGLMQITLDTARFLGIENRLDPEDSIRGAAHYIRSLHDRLPDRIPEPDRTWMALAAYNIGLGHLHDARILTQRLGKDPDRWVDVREHLPLLTQKKWYKTLKYGYARGHEAVTYVGNIRTYYDMLVWITGAPGSPTEPRPPSDDAPEAPEVDEDSPLRIDNPVL